MSEDRENRPLLLRWTRFESNPHGTGPEKRSFQIRDLVRSAGCEIADLKPPASTPRLLTHIAGLSARLRHGACASVDHAGIGLLGYRSLFYRRALNEHRGAKVLLWETTYDDLLPAMASHMGFRIVALPHNIECFVSERAFADQSYQKSADFPAEVRRLGRADRRFTISKEEKWLLEASGLESAYLPFYPTGSLKTECEMIRKGRMASGNAAGHISGPLLMLGSAINPATARGMKRQLDWLRESLPDAKVTVIGSKTEMVFSEFASSSVHPLGYVTREELIEFLKTCSALLIHTENGAGAVTRIPEALLAGIPVIANSNAARDCHNIAGVNVYETKQDFVSLVQTQLTMPAQPPEPLEAFEHFQKTVLSMVRNA